VRLALWCLLVCGVALAVFGGLLLHQERSALIDGLDNQLEGTAALAPSGATAVLPRPAKHGPPPTVVAGGTDLVPAGIVVTIAHANRQGRIYLPPWTPSPNGQTAPPGKTHLALLDGSVRLVPSCATRESWRVCTERAYGQAGHLVGAAQAAASLTLLQPPLDEMRTWLLLALPAVRALITLGGWTLTGRALAPIDRIRRMAKPSAPGILPAAWVRRAAKMRWDDWLPPSTAC
jgi:hypothetical protein